MVVFYRTSFGFPSPVSDPLLSNALILTKSSFWPGLLLPLLFYTHIDSTTLTKMYAKVDFPSMVLARGCTSASASVSDSVQVGLLLLFRNLAQLGPVPIPAGCIRLGVPVLVADLANVIASLFLQGITCPSSSLLALLFSSFGSSTTLQSYTRIAPLIPLFRMA